MTDIRHLQVQWDDEARAQAAVRRLRLAMARPRPALRSVALLAAMPAAWLLLDRIIAGLVAASCGAAS